MNMRLKNAITNHENICEESNKAVQKCVADLDTQIDNVNAAIKQMEYIQQRLTWNKICIIENRISIIEDKLDLILEKLGD